MSTYVYARVSTFDQYVNGHSIDQQVRSCLEYVKANGLQLGTNTNCGLPGVFIDGGKSAFKKTLASRPGGLAMMQSLQSGDTVVALTVHRLSRRLSDMVSVMEHWVERRISVRFVDHPSLNTDTANGKAMLYILAVMAQLKSELMAARVREGRKLKAEARPQVTKPARFAPIIESSSKDLGAIMQQIAQNRESNKYKFNGTVRIYLRVSTKDQTVESQRNAIVIPDEMRDAPVVWYTDEGTSGFKCKFEKRPAGKKLMADLQPGDAILTLRPDRIFRSIVDAARVTELIHTKGAAIVTSEGDFRTDTAQGRIMMNMMSLFAEIESQDISRMVKLGTFGALATNPAARALRMPKLLRDMKPHHRQKHYQFHNVFTQEDRFLMYIELYLTKKRYKTRREACRVISNKWLKKKGLPKMTTEFGDSAKVYLTKLKKLQKTEYTERRQRAITAIMECKCVELRYPINVETVAWIDRRQDEFLTVAKMFPGRLRDKQALTMLAGSCVNPSAAAEFIERVR